MASAHDQDRPLTSSSSRHRSHRHRDEQEQASDQDRHRQHRSNGGSRDKKGREASSHHHSSHRSSHRSRSRSRSAERDDRDKHGKRRKKDGGDGEDLHRSSHSRRSSSSRYQDDEERHRSSRHGNKHKETRDESRQKIIDDDTDRRINSASRANLPANGTGVDAGVLSQDPPEDHIPTSESLSLTSKAIPSRIPDPVPLPGHAVTATKVQREEWMLSSPQLERQAATRSSSSAADAPSVETGERDDDHAAREQDYFSSLGQERQQKKQKADKPDPEKLQISSRELNTQLVEGKSVDEYVDQPRQKPQHGAPGHQWRMMKLRRVYEAAEEERRPVEQVALERYASLDEFNEARAERQFLDDRDRARGKRMAGGPAVAHGAAAAEKGTPIQNVTRRSFMFSDSPGPAAGLGSGGPSRPSSRQSFRRPGEASMPSTPLASTPGPMARDSSFRQSGYDTPGGRSDSSTKPGTPIPNVFTPIIRKQGAAATKPASTAADGASSEAMRHTMEQSQTRDANTRPPLSANELNKLQAKAMRAELMGAPNSAGLKDEYERESARARSGGDRGRGFFSTGGAGGAVRPMIDDKQQRGGDKATEVQVLPTLDGQGRLYDVGAGAPGDADPDARLLGTRRKKDKFETHDSKTGERLRYNKDDDNVTLADLVRQERFGGGSKDQKDLDAELASHIMYDATYENKEDYIDDNSERLARKKMKSDAMKRQFAIQNFAKTKKVLDTCIYCWQEEGSRPPRATVISSGTRVYLSLPEYESLTAGHCLIVPMQHHLSSLEAEDDTWDEIKNFMKCLIQAAAKRDEQMVFYETVLNLKHQKHTVIEAVSVPSEVMDVLPGVFKESLMMVEDEWSTNAKVIDLRPKGFRRTMVPQLPYFMVQFDYKGERGYGHVIEKSDGAIADPNDGGNAFDVDERGRSGGDFPRWFAAEIIGNLLELEPRRWMRPKRLSKRDNDESVQTFKGWWDEVDWTKMLVAAADAEAAAAK